MKEDNVASQFEIKRGIQGIGVFAKRDFLKDSHLFTMHGEILDHPTRTSVQIGEHEHIEDEIAGAVNHACSPSAKVDRATRSFITVRDIKKGEEITFDYRENEDTLANPFVCSCCQTEITGKKLQPV
ncbi:MAG: SET domain-containing protein [Gammaproteobacteria bacterium]|nr:SET domain-containing protein [Gammaproteobacteria bacterium]